MAREQINKLKNDLSQVQDKLEKERPDRMAQEEINKQLELELAA